MARQAEADRERRARIITADGEFQASRKLSEAAEIMSTTPAALQLRLLQTVVEVAAEKNSTLVLPFPVELLRFLDGATEAVKNGMLKQPSGAAAERLERADGAEAAHDAVESGSAGAGPGAVGAEPPPAELE
jgi:regulator of protease activity HflC (stomatin/prohibitin superfamily)